MHFHALPHHHSYLIYAFEKPPSTSSTGAFEALHITGIPFTNISNFLKTNRCSCAMRRKLYFTLFVFQKPVARQLCWVFTMSSFSVTSDSRIIISSEARNLCYSLTLSPHVPRTSPLSSSVFPAACTLSAPTGYLPLEEKAIHIKRRSRHHSSEV